MQGQNSFPAPPEILEPRFFLAPNSSKLCVATDTRSKPNHHRYTRDLVVGKAYAVRLRVEGSRCRVFLNDECVSDEQNLDASRVDGAMAAVWVGDGMHNDGHGASLRKLWYGSTGQLAAADASLACLAPYQRLCFAAIGQTSILGMLPLDILTRCASKMTAAMSARQARRFALDTM